MTRRVMTEYRSDFRGGLNTQTSKDLLRRNELLLSTNVRLTYQHGALTKRTGTRRMHETALGSGNPITGITQWDGPSGKQIVAICNGRLYHRYASAGEYAAFTELVPGTAFSTTVKQSIATFRGNASGAPLYLYIADGNYQRWTGAALTDLTAVGGATTFDTIQPFHTRMFARASTYVKNAFWSVLGDAEDWTAALGTGGGNGEVDVLTGEAINAYALAGSSLIIGSEDSLVRFTGYSSEDIRIYQDTEGISNEIGPVGKNAMVQAAGLIFLLSEEGLFYANEAGVYEIGLNIEPDMAALDRDYLYNAVVAYHKGRKELWFAVPGASDNHLNKTVYIYSLRLQTFYGPFTYPFGITSMCRYEDANGAEWLIAGCADGFVRHMDFGAKDDLLYDNSGGSVYAMTAELAPIFFDSGPHVIKSLTDSWFVQADITTAKTPAIKVAFDAGSFTSFSITGIGSGVQDYEVKVVGKGKRMRVQLYDNTDDIPIFNGLIMGAYDYTRN